MDKALEIMIRELKIRKINLHVFSVITDLNQLKHAKLEEKIANHDLIYIPICHNVHYVVFLINKPERWIYYYDSNGNFFGSKWIESWRYYIKSKFNVDGVKFTHITKPHQTDAVCCGAYAIAFIAISAQYEKDLWDSNMIKVVDTCKEILNKCRNLC